ncbi:regulatory protein RecX [Amphritea sp. HPY]|uniref:regulatory protein RecX n=1 Tax=Amphritea sp. HPY TaxID=3421652 RepID=UPI003D7D6B1C
MFKTEQEAKSAALYLLSRREYSRKELTEKLAKKSESIGLDNVLNELVQSGYQSDRRFTESFIRMRIGQGHGLIRIRFDLQRKGIQSEMIEQVLESMEPDWFELAQELYRRKYRTALAANDYKDKAKRIRYMSQRGFSMDQCLYAMAENDQN